ncbi:MAG: aminotransferase class V-fold PLP-dependent enzyme [Anaerolineales bacterium]
MNINERYNFTELINARGTYTPLGVSRSSEFVCQSVAEALSNFYLIDELQNEASRVISHWSGAEAGAVTHCTSAGITLSVAAAMAGDSLEKVAALPNTNGMPDRVVMPAGHVVNYGHSILQDLRLAGAKPFLAGTEQLCTREDIEDELTYKDTACLLLVSSRLVKGDSINFKDAVEAAHRRGVPAIVDGAAQDLRVKELLATGADLVLVSAQKYLAGPTAGLVIGKAELVRAVRAHEKGIGRGMKATKEGIIGALAAIEQRKALGIANWMDEQEKKTKAFVRAANNIKNIEAWMEPDPIGLPFSRIFMRIKPNTAGISAKLLQSKLRASTPSIRVMKDRYGSDQILLELVPLTDDEVEIILEKINAFFNERTFGQSLNG